MQIKVGPGPSPPRAPLSLQSLKNSNEFLPFWKKKSEDSADLLCGENCLRTAKVSLPVARPAEQRATGTSLGVLCPVLGAGQGTGNVAADTHPLSLLDLLLTLRKITRK